MRGGRWEEGKGGSLSFLPSLKPRTASGQGSTKEASEEETEWNGSGID